MGFFDRLEDAFERREERREWREELFEEREELLEEEWALEGAFYDPYLHGELFFDPEMGHHGVMYGGRWHPLEYAGGSWMFVHPRRFNLARRYQPRNLQQPQPQGYGASYSQPQAMPQPQPARQTCPQCHASQPVGTHFCASCGNDLQATAAPENSTAYCNACGATLQTGARFCSACGRSQV